MRILFVFVKPADINLAARRQHDLNASYGTSFFAILPHKAPRHARPLQHAGRHHLGGPREDSSQPTQDSAARHAVVYNRPCLALKMATLSS